MKRLIPFLSLAFLIAACNGNPQTTEVKALPSAQQTMDTAGLAQFQQWKAQNELNAAVQQQQTQTQPVEAAPPKTVEVVRERVVEKPAPVHKKTKPTQTASAPATPAEQTTTTNSSTTASTNSTAQTTGSGSSQNTSSGEAKAPEAGQETAKKGGWSNGAKGATVGGVGGAVIGAVINKKNRGAGAVIGGIIGAGVGYGIGRKKDKKDTTGKQ